MTDVMPDVATRRRDRSTLLAMAFALAVLVIAAYVLGRSDSDTTERRGPALSALGAISVVADGTTFSVPLDVAWVDAQGSYHPDGRPDCLPPVGLGDIDTRFATSTVEDPGGVSREQVIWVDCEGWDASERLSPEQQAALQIELDLQAE